jgi:DNA-binding HxlR family transcriptional regulator
VNSDEPRDVQSSEARRAAFQAGWDSRLLPLLTAEWQSSVSLAKTLGEKPATVLERLKDMLDRGLVDRRVVKAVPSKPTKSGKRPRIHTARFEAHFRLPKT